MDNLENNEEAEKYLELAKQAYDEENYEEAFNLFEKAAEQDITYAQRTIAWMYYYGEGVCQDLAKAKEWYDKFPLRKEISSGTPEFRLLSSIFGESKYNIEFQDIINNNSEASYRIGEMFHYGDYIKQDFSKAFEWFENAVKQGNDKAQNMIDILYKNRKQDSLKTSDKIKRDENLSVHNEFINKNISNEAKYMEVCKDNAIALCRFGFMYYSIEKDYSKAFKFFEKAAEYCNEYAQRMLAWMYYYGEGVNQNLVKAKEWYDKFPLKDQSFHFSFEDIVVTKDTKAQYAVGRMFYYGNYIKKDYLKAFEWVEKAAKQGNTDAQNMLGVLYINGNGVRQDFLKARDWYLRAAINDNAIAQYNIGRMYYSGNGIETNYEEAFKWFEKSACHNYQYAKNMLGTLYKEGKGVAQDYFKAKEWYEKAGYFEPAQYNLSLMYFYGTGVQRDYQKAYELCRAAAREDRWGNIYIVAQKFLPKIKNYRTPLMEAAFSNSVSEAEKLIKNKVDVDERNMMNRTALMFAADNNSLDVAKLLIESGADVNAHAYPYKYTRARIDIRERKVTALIYAACNDSFDVAKLLIESGADVNAITDFFSQRTAFWFATINNSVKVAKLLIESGADIYYDIDEIIKSNSIDIVRLLISTKGGYVPPFSTDCIGKDSLNMVKLLNEFGFTSKNKSILLFAAKKNYVDIVKYLIDLGIDVNTTTTYRITLLMEAAINNAVDVARFLIDTGADLNAMNSANKTALMLAVENNSVKIVKMLIDAGAAINTTFQNSTEQSQLSHPPKIEFYVQGELVSKTVFNDMLLNRKQAKRTWFYIDGSKKEEIWNAFRFTEYSDLMANIKSSATYRKWKEKGIIKVEYNID